MWDFKRHPLAKTASTGGTHNSQDTGSDSTGEDDGLRPSSAPQSPSERARASSSLLHPHNAIPPSKSSMSRQFTAGLHSAGSISALSLSGPSRTLSRLLTTSVVNFRDVNLTLASLPTEDLFASGNSEEYDLSKLSTEVQKNKLILILVGLPGRGKTFLCNKLKAYLNWLGHCTKHFNVGNYRRQQKGQEVQDAEFFDAKNEAGMEARQKALQAALDEMTEYLKSDEGQVAIFDATNSTNQRRQQLRDYFHGKWQYLFIETVCTDVKVLEMNYLNKLLYSPDYKGVSKEQGVEDFKARIKKYEETYEPIVDRNMHFIKLIDLVTGRGHMDINRISGYIPGKIVFFSMQVCKAGLANVRKIWLTRHGESEYNRKKLLGGDSNLSEAGERYARQLPGALVARLPQSSEEVQVSVWTSTLRRTIATARHIPFPKLRWKALDEIDAGTCDDLTYAQVAERFPLEYEARNSDKLRYRYPSGESYLDVIQRVEPVVVEVERERECICIVSHQAVLRCILGYFMNIDQEKLPSIEIPLNTLFELTPMPDGTMALEKISVDIDGPIPDVHITSIAMGSGHACRDEASGTSPGTPASPAAVVTSGEVSV